MKKQTNKTHHRHNNLIPPSSLQHPPHLFNTNHSQPLHLIFKACFSPNHSTPIRNSILTPTKSQSKYSTIIMILYACTNEKYLIPISVPILPHTTPQDRIIPHTIILHSTNILTVLYKHRYYTRYSIYDTNNIQLSFSPHTTYSSSLSLTQRHPKHPLHYTTTLFIRLPIPCQPDTHINSPYIHIHTYNSPFITQLQLLLTTIMPYNKYAYT